MRFSCINVGFWSYWPDLNRRPADYESAALPTEPQQRVSLAIISVYLQKVKVKNVNQDLTNGVKCSNITWLTAIAVAYGEVAQLAERARLEIVYTPKGYRGFKSLLLRHKENSQIFLRVFFFRFYLQANRFNKFQKSIR